VLEFTKGLLASSPGMNEPSTVEVQQFVSGMLSFMKDYCSRTDELNRASYSALSAMLQDLAYSESGQASLASLCDKIRIRLQEERVGASSSRPGHLHVTSFHRAGAASRQNNFIVGLQEHAFPGTLMEDPILLDTERKSISDRLPLSTDRFDEGLFFMYAHLAGIRGRVTLSFSSYNVEEGRDVAPSPLILKAFRLVSRNPGADFTAIQESLGHPASYSSDHPVDEKEWWLARLLPQATPTKARKMVLGRFTHLARGLAAVQARESDDFTEYDGSVRVDATIDDPRRNHALVLSASKIETLAECPFEYFVRHILGLEPPEDIEYDPTVWLDSAERGSLLHSIYEEFMRGVATRGEKVQAERHRPFLMEIGEKLVQEKKMEIPPPSDQVFEGERLEIVASLDIFLRMEEVLSSKAQPKYFELQFGVGNVEKGEVGRSEPVTINIDKDNFLLRGFIDRVDQLKDHEFRVLDYKTGSTFGFSSKGHFEKGKKIQHCLYSRAAESILREQVDRAARVVEGGYYFPTRKGEAQLFLRVQKQSRDLDTLLQTLFDIIASGAFLPREDQCYLCRDYDLCGVTRKSVSAKLENSGNKTLEPLRKLDEYA
jgi:ATP-dependent helicase/DNAse subunit B